MPHLTLNQTMLRADHIKIQSTNAGYSFGKLVGLISRRRGFDSLPRNQEATNQLCYTNIMAYKNVEDARSASKRNYLLNKQKYIDKRERLRQELLSIVNILREETPCTDCGIQYPYYVMDFDHLPEYVKVDNVITLALRGATKLLQEEIKKCEIVCANCHRERTQNRRV